MLCQPIIFLNAWYQGISLPPSTTPPGPLFMLKVRGPLRAVLVIQVALAFLIVIAASSWMFMGLVSQTTQQHVLKDDLESLIYVLLWMALMCLETSNPEQSVLFLKTVLDQQPFEGLGSYQKADFLKGRAFLNLVKFVNRPALDE